jgi:KDO2-lipid IV(A) lauroyltransferase
MIPETAPLAGAPLWLRFAARIPLPMLYAICRAASWLALHVFGWRRRVVRENLRRCFPQWSPQQLRRAMGAHYRQVGEMIAEVLRGARLGAAELSRRVVLQDADVARQLLAAGRPVLMVGPHQANWEWVLQVLSLDLGYPLDVGYKPIKSGGVNQAMNRIRRRFGAHLVPAKELLADLLQRRHIVRGIAMLADQEPVTSDHKHWVSFLGRETAFYLGPEQMARATRYAAVFVAMRRLRRGYYEARFLPLAAAGEVLAPGEFTARYARLVEAEIRAAPSDWTWGHRRWKLKRGLYSG